MGGMADVKYTKAEFEAYYNALHNDLEAEVKAGKRKEIGNVYKKLVEDQAYDMSLDQARVAKKMLRENFDREFSLREIRAANFSDRTKKQYDEINAAYHKKLEELQREGVRGAGKQAGMYIAQMYYGSN